jgi:hypothetical protein
MLEYMVDEVTGLVYTPGEVEELARILVLLRTVC